MIPPGIITHQQLYRPSDSNTDYWVDDTSGNNNPSAPVFPEGIIHPVVSVTITGSIPLLMNYYSPEVSSTQ
jgi:hypothetical protein